MIMVYQSGIDSGNNPHRTTSSRELAQLGRKSRDTLNESIHSKKLWGNCESMIIVVTMKLRTLVIGDSNNKTGSKSSKYRNLKCITAD